MHIGAWLSGELSQREYCEVHAISRKNFTRWRAVIKYEDAVLERRALLRHRRRPRLKPGLSPGSNPSPNETVEAPLAVPKPGRRRYFAEEIKRRIVEETRWPGMSVSEVARRYGIASNILFRWRKELGLAPKAAEATFLPVVISGPNGAIAAPDTSGLEAMTPNLSILIERPMTAIEIELSNGRKVRVDAHADPQAVRRLVRALEESAP